MTPFIFNTTRSIISGPGKAAEIGGFARPLLGERVLLVTDSGLLRSGLLEPSLASLRAAGCVIRIFDEVVADPPEAIVLAAAQAAKDHNATGVLSIGGGSPMDVAKLAALLARSGESLADIYGLGNVKGPRLPLMLVPTTAGTGSEVTLGAIEGCPFAHPAAGCSPARSGPDAGPAACHHSGNRRGRDGPRHRGLCLGQPQ
jgi:alcohol dehydrogenase class IV